MNTNNKTKNKNNFEAYVYFTYFVQARFTLSACYLFILKFMIDFFGDWNFYITISSYQIQISCSP